MTHKAADDLSNVIDEWLTHSGVGRGEGLGEIVDALGGSLPHLADQAARERVRRRLVGISPRPRSAQELLIERAVDELDRLQHRLREEDYVPWSAVASAAVVVVAAVGLAIWLRRKGLDQPITG
jgi:hypothetical protein